jgi:hypothetical protein
MKKDKTVPSNKKLALNKQTIRELRPVELERPAGGTRGNDEFDNGGGSDTCPC